MAPHNTLDIRQPDPGALKFVLAVQSLEHAKQFSHIFRIKSRAVVANGDHRFAASSWSKSDLDSRLRTIAGELDRIGNQIDPHQTQESAVSPDDRQRSDCPDNLPIFRFRLL